MVAEDRDSLLQSYRESRAKLLDAIDGLSEAQMSERSMDGWSVNDHLGHLALWDEIRAHEVMRISAGHESLAKMSSEQDAAYNDIGYALRGEMSAAQAMWELESTRRRLLDAIAAATSRGLDGSLYGEAGLRSGHEAEHAKWIRQWREQRGY